MESRVEGLEKTLATLEMSRREDNDRLTRLETQDDFSRKLDWLIELLSLSRPKGDEPRAPEEGEPSHVEEKDSEEDNRGLWSNFSDRPVC